MADFAAFFYKMHMMKQQGADCFYEIIEPLFKIDGLFYAVVSLTVAATEIT
jgi:hypothetical protein